MDPDRRAMCKIEPNRTDRSDRTDNENNEYGWTIGGVMMGIVEVANVAAIRNLQKPTKKPALPASWAATGHGF